MLSRKLPLWYQLAQTLRTQILSGELANGCKVEPETELAVRHGVSVITVRQALKSLESEGLISRHRGRGTFVTAQCPSRRELKLIGSVETIVALHLSENTTVLQKGFIPVPADLQSLFPDTDRLIQFRRLRQEEGLPFSYAINHVLPEYGRRISAAQLRRYSMVKILRDSLQIALGTIKLSVEATTASGEVAKILEIDLHAPVLRFSGVGADQSGRVIDFATIYYRADRFQFTVDIDVSGEGLERSRQSARGWELSERRMPLTRYPARAVASA